MAYSPTFNNPGFNVSNIMQGNSLNFPSDFLASESLKLPSSIKDIFKLILHAYLTDSNMKPILENMASYPITELIPEDDVSVEDLKKWTEVLEDILDIKAKNVEWGIDYLAFGNTAVSLYTPFNRIVTCPQCSHENNITINKKIAWVFKDGFFHVYCENCNKDKNPKNWVQQKIDNFELVRDEPDGKNIENFSVNKWNIFEIEISQNPISGKRKYAYKIPGSIADRIKKGDKSFIEEVPLPIIKQVQYNMQGKGPLIVELDKDMVRGIHRPMISMPNGEFLGWGLPVAIAALRDIFYKNVMRRAQAVVLYEHILPFRVFSPIRNDEDPLTLDGSMFATQVKNNYEEFRRNPGHIMISPVPVNVQQIGGQGKGLTMFAEINETDKNIVKAHGVSQSFAAGDMTYANASVSLRMLENLFMSYLKPSVRIINWIISKVAALTGMKPIKVKYVKFKMNDDIQFKQLILNLYDKGLVSAEFLGEIFDYNSVEQINKRRKEDAKRNEDTAGDNAVAQIYANKVLQGSQVDMPTPAGITDNINDPDMVQQITAQLKNAKPEQASAVLQQINAQNPELAKAVQDQLTMTPQQMAQDEQRQQQIPEEIRAQNDIAEQAKDPAKFAMKKIMFNNLFYPQEDDSEQSKTDMRPNSEKLPPRRQNPSM